MSAFLIFLDICFASDIFGDLTLYDLLSLQLVSKAFQSVANYAAERLVKVCISSLLQNSHLNSDLANVWAPHSRSNTNKLVSIHA